MKTWKLASCVVGILALGGVGTSLSQSLENIEGNRVPSTQESAPSIRAERPEGAEGGYRLGRFGYGAGFYSRTGATTVEWEDTARFMKEHSPERLKVITELGEENQRRYRLIGLAVRTYRNVERAKSNDPQLAALMITRMELEDQIFGLVGQIKQAKKSAGDVRPTIFQDALREKVAQLVDTNIAERELRLSHLQQTVKQEQAKLEQDSANRERLVDRRVRGLMDTTSRNVPSTAENAGNDLTTPPITGQ